MASLDPLTMSPRSGFKICQKKRAKTKEQINFRTINGNCFSSLYITVLFGVLFSHLYFSNFLLQTICNCFLICYLLLGKYRLRCVSVASIPRSKLLLLKNKKKHFSWYLTWSWKWIKITWLIWKTREITRGKI